MNHIGVRYIDWANWPWQRCKAVLPKDTPGAGGHYGRCDLKKKHEGDHLLERGFDMVPFRIEVTG